MAILYFQTTIQYCWSARSYKISKKGTEVDYVCGRTVSGLISVCSYLHYQIVTDLDQSSCGRLMAEHYVILPLHNILKPTGHVMHQQFNIQQLYVVPTLYLCVLYLSESKQRLVPLKS